MKRIKEQKMKHIINLNEGDKGVDEKDKNKNEKDIIKIEKNKNKLKYFRIIKLKFWCYLCYFGSACKSFL
jgi:hypothetical protein